MHLTLTEFQPRRIVSVGSDDSFPNPERTSRAIYFSKSKLRHPSNIRFETRRGTILASPGAVNNLLGAPSNPARTDRTTDYFTMSYRYSKNLPKDVGPAGSDAWPVNWHVN